jgi:hypothetical protein
MYPVHRRWLSAFPAEGQVWTPTLYCGLIPLIAALSTWRKNGWGEPRQRWLTCVMLIGLLCSFGWYGVGWIIHELTFAMTGGRPWIGQPTGGCYWFLTTLLPGYAYFRYPAKWLVVAALGCSLLAARGLDQVAAGGPQARRLTKYLGIFSLVLALGIIAGREFILDRMQRVRASNLFGPIDATGAWSDVCTGLIFAAVVCALLAWLWRSKASEGRVHLPMVFVLVTALDLLVANHWLVATVPDSVFTGPSQAANALHRARRTLQTHGPPIRLMHADFAPRFPRQWSALRNPKRLTEIVNWERDMLTLRHHLRFGIATLDAPATIRSAEWLKYLEQARQTAAKKGPGLRSTDFDWLGLDFWVASATQNAAETNAVQLAETRQPWPRAWLTTDPWIPPVLQRYAIPTPNYRAGSARILRYGPQRVEVEVRSKRLATLILTDAFDPNWTVKRYRPGSSVGEPIRLHQVGSLVRGVDLPAGTQLVVFTYRPVSFWLGSALTLLSFSAAGFCLWQRQ